MSFQASHLHFAQKVQHIIKPQDLTRYFSGTLYPDSRYLTKVERAKTHNGVKIEPKKILYLTDDFDKGWQVHLWYDKLGMKHINQISLGRQWLPQDSEDIKAWIHITGAKLVEDLYWWQNTDWSKILPYLKLVTSPYQEDSLILNSWYQHFIDFYQKNPEQNAYRKQAGFIGISPEKSDQIQLAASNFYNNTPIRLKIEQVMDQVVEEFKNLIISK